jgi:TonB family protein
MRVALGALLLLAGSGAHGADDELLAVAPQQLPKAWELERRAWDEFVDPDDASRYGCAAVSFIIEADGSTSDYRLLRSVPEGEFVDAAQRIVKAFQFEPGKLNAKRAAVFTYLTISFNGRGERSLGSNIRQPVTIDSRVNKLCAVEGFDFGGE